MSHHCSMSKTIRTLICVLKINAFLPLHVICMLGMSKFHYSIAEGIVFFGIISIFVNGLLPSSNKNMYSSLVKISVLHLQPLTYYQAVPHHSHCLSQDQTGENLMQRGQECTVSGATPSILCWPQCCTHF